MIDSRAPQARRLEPEKLCEFDDHVGEEGVQEEEEDQNPLENCVDENQRNLVGVPVQHGRKSVRRHSCFFWTADRMYRDDEQRRKYLFNKN